jgi:hypothetical protein
LFLVSGIVEPTASLLDGAQVVVKDGNLRGQPAQIRGLVELGGGRTDLNAPVVFAVDGRLTFHHQGKPSFAIRPL